MDNKIALEEHFASPDTIGDSERFFTHDLWQVRRRQLLDFQEERIERMDACGIGYAILSLNAPAVQAITDRQRAIDVARRANDLLAEQVARRPERFGAFAALPLQDPEAAARELERAVGELGFQGALVNGFSQVGSEDDSTYYDLPQYWPFWAEVERLGVPFYLHPRDQLASRRQAYDGHTYLVGSPWGFADETAIHALRLMGSGLFDAFPKLKIVLGHLGERIPYDLWRLDHRLRKVPNRPAKRAMGDYFRQNFYISTSGHFCTQSLIHAILTVGADRVLFAVDYPFEDHAQGSAWFDAADIAEADRRKIGRDNAVALFGLG
jgi:2,3-dihydroxybenzoate decarboxylase